MSQTNTEERLAPVDIKTNAAARSGAELGFGAGYMMYADGISHIEAGYVWDFHFGLFGDVAVYGGLLPIVGIRAAVTPKFVISHDNFVFSGGVGIGCIYAFFEFIAFMLRPVLDFDWFVSDKWFTGFTLAASTVGFYSGLAELYFHFGVKF